MARDGKAGTPSPIVTVAVPAFRRADMLRPLIRSFQLQTLTACELLVCDDSGNDDSVATVVAREAALDGRIRLERNPENIGYSKNFLRCLELSHGQFIVVLGDDDLLASPHALRRYAEAFARYPDAAYVYSNVLQFNSKYELDYVFEHFREDQHFPPGLPSLEGTWLKSCYIPGIGLRNELPFTELYPEQDMLFPQVELIGRLLLTRESCGLSEFAVAGRAHEKQLGFEAIQGRRVKADERHAVHELNRIAQRIESNTNDHLPCVSITRRFFRHTQATIYPVEKIHTGNSAIAGTLISSVRSDPGVLLDVRYLAYFTIAFAVPSRALHCLKEWRKRRIIGRRFSAQAVQFRRLIRQLGVD